MVLVSVVYAPHLLLFGVFGLPLLHVDHSRSVHFSAPLLHLQVSRIQRIFGRQTDASVCVCVCVRGE